MKNNVLAIHEADMLYAFATTFLDHPEYPLSRRIRSVLGLVRPSLAGELKRRSFAGLPFDKIRTRPTLEILRTVSERVLSRPQLADWIWEREEHDLDRWVASMVAPHLDAVYAYEHGALATLERARSLGVVSFWECPSQHHAFYGRVYERETRTHPGLRRSAVAAIQEDPHTDRRNARKDREAATADHVFCYSTFTKRTLTEAGVDPEKVQVVPLAFPSPEPKRQEVPEKVVFLNAGTQSIRKGSHILCRAWRAIQPSEAELRLYGAVELPEEWVRDLPGNTTVRPSIPHVELLDEYKEASVFVLASLADGFAMVVTEAMSRGLPVIVTDATGAADLVDHGTTGFVVPAGDEEALVEKMLWFTEHKEQIPVMGAAAVEAAGRRPWSVYRKEQAATVRRLIKQGPHRPPIR